jgi:hypothetical protein
VRSLRHDKVLRPTTIDQYFHARHHHYKEHNVITSHTALRSPRLNMMLTGYDAADKAGLPTRIKEKIPLHK